MFALKTVLASEPVSYHVIQAAPDPMQWLSSIGQKIPQSMVMASDLFKVKANENILLDGQRPSGRYLKLLQGQD